jgi:hypothetical protein
MNIHIAIEKHTKAFFNRSFHIINLLKALDKMSETDVEMLRSKYVDLCGNPRHLKGTEACDGFLSF